ncbi:MAG TPA: rhamnan synthesis F family protein [Propionibacteriaceae bacterium]|nr:rhamnan synthesis F family protein [Propionibacteriaceae bacterium]
MTSTPEAQGPTRLAVYLVEGRPVPGWRVPPHVLTALRGLRPYVDLLVVAVSTDVGDTDRTALGGSADLVLAEEGLSHASVIRSLLDRVATYDQVLLTGSGWFGPVADLGSVLDRMAGVEVWSLLPQASRPAYDPALRLGPDPDWYVMPGHLAASDDLAAWRESGSSDDLVDSGRYAFPPEDYPSADPALMNLPALLDDGLPYVPVESFVVDPLVADRLAVVPADGFARLRHTGIDMGEVWHGLLDAAPLRVLTTNLGLTRVLGPAAGMASGTVSSAVSSLRTAALLHLYYDELTDDLMDRVDLLPGEVHVVVTTTDEQRRASIETRLSARARQYSHEVRVLPSNRGRDISALLVGCADVLRDPSYDLVVKLHGKRSVQDDVNASGWFRRHLLDNLFPDASGTAGLYEWFSADPQLGIAVPPVIHMYYPTMGHAWLGNRALAESLAERLGVTVPLDDHTPVAPYGSMFVARREALEPWLSLGLTWEDFPEGAAYADGTLAHAIERMFCYVAAGTGRYTGTVLGRETVGIEYGFLEYKLQAVGSRMPAYAVDQVAFLDGGVVSWRALLQRRLPRLVERLRPLYRRLRTLRSHA